MNERKQPRSSASDLRGESATGEEGEGSERAGEGADRSAQEVCQQKAKARSHEDSAGLYLALFERAPDGILLTDDDDLILDANGALCELVGASREALIGQSSLVLVPPDYDPGPAREERRRRGGKLRETIASRGPDGSPTWLEYTFMAAIAPGVNAAIVRDVTERERAKQGLARESETLRAVLSASPVAIDVLDAEGRVQVWNPAAESLFGLRAEDVMGARFEVSDQEEFERDLEAVAAGESFRGRIVRRVCRGGQERELSVSRAPVRSPEGHITASVGVYVDVTERRQLEAHLAQSQKMEAIGRLAGGIAHDYNNVLAAIRGFSASLIEELGREGDVGEDLSEIVAATDRAAALTRKLVAFSRRQPIAREPIELDAVVGGVERMLERVIGEDVELSVVRGAAGLRIVADAGQIEQVLVNLAVNARDAMPRGGELAIETRAIRPAGELVVELRVRDDGEGMDEHTRTRAVEPFFTTKPVGQGTGTGLATVYAIVTQSGGDIAIDSAPGKGTAVVMTFPVHEAPERDRRRGEAEGARGFSIRDPSEREARNTSPLRAYGPKVQGQGGVLVVEDEESVRRLVRRILEHRGYRVLTAPTGHDALALFAGEESPIEVLLTDVVMPKMSGPELAERVAELSPDTRIVYMSGYADERVTGARAMERAYGILDKPFEREALVDLVERAFSNAPARTSSSS